MKRQRSAEIASLVDIQSEPSSLADARSFNSLNLRADK